MNTQNDKVRKLVEVLATYCLNSDLTELCEAWGVPIPTQMLPVSGRLLSSVDRDETIRCLAQHALGSVDGSDA